MIAESRPFLPDAGESLPIATPHRVSLAARTIAAPSLDAVALLRPSGRVLIFGFAAFLPYPSVPAGEHTAIQAGNVLVLLLTRQCFCFRAVVARSSWSH